MAIGTRFTPSFSGFAAPTLGAELPSAIQTTDDGAGQLELEAILREARNNPEALNRLDPKVKAELEKLLGIGNETAPTTPPTQATPRRLDAIREQNPEQLLQKAADLAQGGATQPADLAALSQLLASLSPTILAALAQLWQQQQEQQGGTVGDWANGGSPLAEQLGQRLAGTESPEPSYDTSNVTMPEGDQGKLLSAISGQESGGRYDIVNPDSGALGKYQVMPANVASWSKEALGHSISPQEFLRSPDLQEKIVGHKLEQYYKEGMSSTGSQEGAVRFAAAKWYSGRGEKWNDTRPQSTNGRSYPSIASYTSSVWQRFQGKK